MYKILGALTTFVLIVVFFTEFLIPLILNKPLFGSFKRNKKPKSPDDKISPNQ